MVMRHASSTHVTISLRWAMVMRHASSTHVTISCESWYVVVVHVRVLIFLFFSSENFIILFFSAR